MTMCVGHQLKKDNDPFQGGSSDERNIVKFKNNDLIDDNTKYYDKDTRTNSQHKNLGEWYILYAFLCILRYNFNALQYEVCWRQRPIFSEYIMILVRNCVKSSNFPT